MKYLMLALVLFSTTFLSAQETGLKVYKFMKADNVEAFENHINAGNDINECLSIKDALYTYLTMAIKMNSQAIFAKCIELDADLELICSDKTPLMYAVKYDRHRMFMGLMKSGVDKDQKSKKGRTAKDYAVKYKMPHFAKQLE